MSDPLTPPTTHATPDPVPQGSGRLQSPRPGNRARGALQGLALDLTPLRISREFRLLYIGQSISFFGTMMSFVVIPWQMYQLTNSTLAVGLLGIAEFAPILLMAFVGGALADYVDRRLMVRLTELALAVGTVLLILNSHLTNPRVSVLYFCAALFAAVNGLQRPSLSALVPKLLPPEHLPAAAALDSLRGSIGMIGGMALGGFLAVTIGPANTYLIDLVTFVVSLVALWMMQATPPPVDAERPSIRSVTEGLRYARSRPELLGTYLIDINAMFFGMPMALFPAIAVGFGGASVGLLYAMPAVGSLFATLTSGWTNRIHRHGLAVAIAAACWGLAIVGFGFANKLWLALIFLALAGAADMVSGLFRMTIWNQTIPDHLRGRLAGIEMVSYTSGPMLGNAEAGIAASLFGIRTAVVSGGILCVIGTGLLAIALPAFLRYDGREGLVRKQRQEAERASKLDQTT